MAIYQYYIALVPRSGLINYFGSLPERLVYENWNNDKSGENTHIKDLFDYSEYIQHKCWKLVKTNPENIIIEIDKRLERANWGNTDSSYNWKTETEILDLDAYLHINKTNKEISEFSFRADLRQPNLTFLRDMIIIAVENDLILVDIKGNLIRPDLDTLRSFIEDSNAHRFLQKPENLIRDIQSGKVKIEGKMPKH